MNIDIFKIETEKHLYESAEVIRRSFYDIAIQYGITQYNVPTNGAFIKYENLLEMAKKGIKMYGLSENGKQIGFVAIERAREKIFYLEKLSVLPEYRHKGYGKKLIDFVCNEVKENEGETVSIALINENGVLKKWYTDYGFQETGIKEFEHLPFKVCFMAINIGVKID